MLYRKLKTVKIYKPLIKNWPKKVNSTMTLETKEGISSSELHQVRAQNVIRINWIGDACIKRTQY